jgi:HK97 family phage prohead protease
MGTYVQGVAVPYGVSTLVAEHGPDGQLQLFREQFTQHSWTQLPDKVALTKTHNEDHPLGWARVRNTKAGLTFEAELIESSMATDAVAAVKAGLIRGLSIAFAEDPEQDQWERGGRGQPPLVHRRGASLRHVALVANPSTPQPWSARWVVTLGPIRNPSS